MREFYLSNENNEIFDLMGRASDFLHAPDGLGFEYDITYSKHNLTRRSADKRLNFGKVQGEIIFAGYLEYSAFVTYVARSATMKLHYKPNDTIGIYYVNTEVATLNKAEIDNEIGVLRCPVQFDLLGYWTKDEIVVSGTGGTGGAENQPYPFTYPITYGRSLGSSQFMALTLTNNGHAPAPLKITIRGQAINPTWSLGDQQGGLTITIQAGQSVDIDCRETVMAIKSGDTVLDQFKDHAKQNYIYAPVGTSTILIEATDAEVTLYEQYASV